MINANKVMAYRLSLWIGIPTSLIGFYLHRTDFILSDVVIAIGAICAVIVLALGLIHIFSNNKIKKTEKIMWVSGHICPDL